MAITRIKCFALITSALLSLASAAYAQDSKALIDALIKKGVLTVDDAQQIEKDLTKNNAAIDVSTSKGKYLEKLTLSGRIQVQFADLGTNISGAPDPAATQHFLLRRVYIGAKAELGQGFSGTINYDFANDSFDAAYVTWKQSDALAVDAGLRKVPVGYEEYTSSANLKAIERSPATRYFVESNNGRRLGAGSYHTGVYVGGTKEGVFYNVAITNPERDEFSSNVGNATGVQNTGSTTGANNNLAYWANLGYGDKFEGGSYKVGIEGAYLPDQGGLVLGKGNNLTVYGVLADVTVINDLNFQAEYLSSKNDNGNAAGTADAKPKGYWIQAAYKLGNLEPVVRYSSLDSDGRGVNVADGTRSAPSGGTMNKMSEWYLGGSWYIRGNDLKLQAGYVHAESKDLPAGGSAKATSDGFRSQLQLNF